MDGLDHSEAFGPRPRSAQWPHQLAAAASLAGLVLVWLCVLPFATLAFCVLSLIEAARRAMAPRARA